MNESKIFEVDPRSTAVAAGAVCLVDLHFKYSGHGGQFAAICDGPDVSCSAVKMPKQLGKVEAIYPGPIIKNARASWIARSKFEMLVCAVVQNTAKVACARMSDEAFPAEYASMVVKYSPTGQTRIAVNG